jgi:hypothetical protein
VHSGGTWFESRLMKATFIMFRHRYQRSVLEDAEPETYHMGAQSSPL